MLKAIPSVCLSVTLAIHAYTIHDIEILLTQYTTEQYVSSFLLPNFVVVSFGIHPKRVSETGRRTPPPVEMDNLSNNLQQLGNGAR